MGPRAKEPAEALLDPGAEERSPVATRLRMAKRKQQNRPARPAGFNVFRIDVFKATY
jgi:hypothetical protein